MRVKNFWEQFEQSGSVSDYLSYTACTREEMDVESDRGDSRDKYNNSDGNGADRHACW